MSPAASREAARIVSWNVNGLRACARKGFGRWLSRCGAEIVALQEVRALPEDLPSALRAPRRWTVHMNPAERLGYSGVALYSRRKPDAVETSLGAGNRKYDVEGRLQIARFGRLVVINGYFPKGSGKERDNSRVPYKLGFYRAVRQRAERLRRGRYRVLVMGDFNTAHREIDLARPRDNVGNSGFLPEERAELDRWIDAGWIDTFRVFEPGPGHYTWWRQWGDAKQKNVGWRIDYVLASPNLRPFLEGAFIQRRVQGSDHVPVGVDLDPAVFG
ncbi:MAG: exodeoxyribonuclease III [Proteobacteria bacterium]|nr:exodeoxyribonuclease III [Pseudomonadota bacterium]